MRALLILILLALCAYRVCAQDTVIEKMDYGDTASARRVWVASQGSLPVEMAPEKTPDGFPALAFSCDMSNTKERSYWDRELSLDMSLHGRISFWVKAVGDLSAISTPTIYFQSQNGWYSSNFTFEKDRWYKVSFDRSSFMSEENPVGWQEIIGMRIAFWKAMPTQAKVYIGPIGTAGGDVLIVRNSRAGSEADPWPADLIEALSVAGIDSVGANDIDVEKGALQNKRIAIFPYNPKMSEAELNAVEDYVQGGGKIVVCYILNERLAKLLGIRDTKFVKQSYDGQFGQMRIIPSDANQKIAALPQSMVQRSWNIASPIALTEDAWVLAQWYDDKAADTGYPAISINKNGIFVSHVLLNDDPANRSALLRAVLGHLEPQLWQKIAKASQINLNQLLSKWNNFDEAIEGMEVEANKTNNTAALQEINNAKTAYSKYLSLYNENKWQQATQSINQSADSLMQAYSMIQQPLPGEFRAVWCHSAYGVAGMDWDQAIKTLKDNGFTAVIPNMLWAGQAEYKSGVLPVGPNVEKAGDQIELCVKAAKKHGLQVHVWKVNWNLDNASKEFVAQMREKNRLQASWSKEELTWLCPSNPENQKLELDSLLEVIRKYDVDGVHFDYIRYYGSQYCYCSGCKERFEASIGKKVANWPKDVLKEGSLYGEYQSFRQSHITALVRKVSEEARKIKPGVKISAAVFSDWPQCREEVGQDWAKWIELGYLDFVCPMDYTASASGFQAMVKTQKKAVKGKVPFYPGIGASAPGLTSVQIIDQILLTREEGTNGFTIFNYDINLATDILPTLGASMTKP